MLATYIPELADTELSLDLDIDSIIDSLAIATDSDSITLSANILGIELSVLLGSENGWTLDSITATIPDFGDIVATPTEYSAVDMGNLSEYIPVIDVVEQILPAIEDLLASTSQTITLEGTLLVDNTLVSYSGTVVIDGENLSIQLLAQDGTLTILDLDVVLYNGVLYLDINGIRTALDTSSIELDTSSGDIDLDGILDTVVTLLPSLEPILNDVFAVIDTATSLDYTTIDYGTLVTGMSYVEGVLSVTLDGSILGLGDIDLSIATNNNITLTLTDFDFSNLNLDATVSVYNSGAVTKPTGDYILSFEITLPVDALNTTIVATVSLDLLNGTVELYSEDLLGATLKAKFVDDTIYLQYGNVNVSGTIDEIIALVDILSPLLGETVALEGLLDIDDLLSCAIGIVNSDDSIVLTLGDIVITLDKGDMLTLGSITASIDGMDIAIELASGDIPAVDMSAQYVTVSQLAQILDSAIDALTGESICIDIDNATVTIDGTVYTISGSINISNGIEIELVLYVDNAKVATVDVVILDNIAYIDVNDIKLALDISSGTSDTEIDSLLGYNDTVDSIIMAIVDMLDNIPAIGDIDLSALISSFGFSGDALSVALDLSQFGLGEASVAIDSNMYITVGNLTLANTTLSVDFAGSIGAGSVVRAKNTADYTTNIVLVIDEYNTVYGNIDIYNNIYKFKLDDLYLEIVGRTFYISCGDLLCTGNVDEIEGYIDDLTALADEFFGRHDMGDSGVDTSDILALFSIDIDDIIASLYASVTDTTLEIGATVAGIDIVVNVTDSVISVQLPLGSKVLNVTTANSSAKYFDFNDGLQYVAIEQLFDDYMPLLEELVASNGWHFDLLADIAIDGARYRIEGSIDLVYYSADDYSIGADIIVYSYNSDGSSSPYMTIELGLVDGRIYISYSNQSNNASVDNKLKFAISLTAIEACADVFGDVLDVVPQLAELIDGITDTLVQLGDQDDMNYASILKNVSYIDGQFNVVIDANMLVNELGDVDLTVSKSGNSLQLYINNFVYDGIVIEYAFVTVAPQTAEVGYANIGTFDNSTYNDLDSLEQLLSTFVVTADDTSFYISGSVTADVLGLVDLTVYIDLYVDIVDTNGDGVDEVYIAAKIDRGQLSTTKALCFSDYGGSSYLYYNGLDDTIRVVRDSYSRKLSWFTYVYTLDSADGTVGYDTGWMASSAFMDNFIDYLLDMLNFSNTIENAITDAITDSGDGEGGGSGIEDILASYSYSNSTFSVVGELEPLSSDLGTLYVNIAHDGSDNLTTLYGSTDFLSGLIDLDYSLSLKTPVPDRAYTYAVGRTLF